ncbi:MAG: tryptophan 2,3-dioxygenase family protein [Catalinimonas sp.]
MDQENRDGADEMLSPELLSKIRALRAKYGATGQDLPAYLEGLFYADYLHYWDYINLDALLGLQTPRTALPDEMIFIVYHQTTELYFKLIRQEIDRALALEAPTGAELTEHLTRVNRYFRVLIESFDVMVDGMEPAQFRRFRMALLPASGFQSVQYRLIEMASTDLINLVEINARPALADAPPEAQLERVYWRKGASQLASGDETLTLRHFEAKYGDELLRAAHRHQISNLRQLYQRVPEDDPDREQLIGALRRFDYRTNVHWPLIHLRAAGRYLDRHPEVIAATGGTNWQRYLPPRYQQRTFFPELWTEEERGTWGREILDL